MLKLPTSTGDEARETGIPVITCILKILISCLNEAVRINVQYIREY